MSNRIVRVMQVTMASETRRLHDLNTGMSARGDLFQMSRTIQFMRCAGLALGVLSELNAAVSHLDLPTYSARRLRTNIARRDRS